MKQLQIQKRDKSLEPWNFDKILISITKAGIKLEIAKQVVTEVENWAKEKAEKGIIKSLQIREKVIEKLKEVDPVAADLYQSYKK